jgi:hypothetical protein
MATNNEDHDGGYVDDILNTQQIADETVEYLRSLRLQITTGKIERGVIEAIRKSELLKRVGELEKRQSTTRGALIRGLSQIVKIISGDD